MKKTEIVIALNFNALKIIIGMVLSALVNVIHNHVLILNNTGKNNGANANTYQKTVVIKLYFIMTIGTTFAFVCQIKQLPLIMSKLYNSGMKNHVHG